MTFSTRAPNWCAAALVAWGILGCGDLDGDPFAVPPDPEADPAGSGRAIAPVPCPTPPLASLSGAATRANDNGYPDSISAAVTWTLESTSGCVDTYAPSGIATYDHLIPGALCLQSIEPANAVIAPGDAVLTIDRSTVPATFTGRGATYWTVTHICTFESAPQETRTFTGGAAWLNASGSVVDDEIAGDYSVDDPDRCGPAGIPPCTFAWSFTASM